MTGKQYEEPGDLEEDDELVALVPDKYRDLLSQPKFEKFSYQDEWW